MADFKQLQVRIWQDNWFLSLKPEEKLLWIFLLTNEHSHISGLYELPMPLICPLTGIKNWENILQKFKNDKKIKLCDGWVFIINKIKHQPIGGSAKDRVNISIKNHFENHKEILEKMNKNKCPIDDPSMLQPQIEIESEIEIDTNVSNVETTKELEIIPNLLKDKQKHIQIIGLYAKAKQTNFTSKEQQSAFLQRNLKAARSLVGYEVSRIAVTMKYLLDNADFKWTLETVGKYIDEDLDKLNKSKLITEVV